MRYCWCKIYLSADCSNTNNKTGGIDLKYPTFEVIDNDNCKICILF